MGDAVDRTIRIIGGLVFVGGVALYVALYCSFLWDIVDSPAGEAPNLDNNRVQIAAGIGGLLGGVFAVAFGIQRQDPTKNEKKLNLGATVTPRAQWVTVVCLVSYFSVGVATLVVVFLNGAKSPQEIQAAATIFVGYVVAIFTALVTGPGRTATDPP